MDTSAFGRRLLAEGIDTSGISWGSDGALEFGEQVEEATRARVIAIRDGWSASEDHNCAIDKRIQELESNSGGYIRGLREFMLAQAAETKRLGGADFMPSKGMQNVKALDDQIRALRAQRLP